MKRKTSFKVVVLVIVLALGAMVTVMHFMESIEPSARPISNRPSGKPNYPQSNAAERQITKNGKMEYLYQNIPHEDKGK